MAAGGTCQNNSCVLHENPGGVDMGTQSQLEGGGNADPSLRFLYPYDKTVFPRGLISPTIQIDGAAPDAVYLHVTFPGMDYQGFYGASSPGRVQMSAAAWKALTEQAQAGDQVKVELTKISGGQVSGPITESWKVAPQSMRGTIYYETYDSPMAGAVAIMKIQPGANTPTVIKQGCGNVCHTASADGSTLVANAGGLAGYESHSSSYDLGNGASTIKAQSNLSFTYGGLYPDGSFLVSATHYRTWAPPFGKPSRLWDTHTGMAIATPSWDNAVQSGGTTAFAPDGKYVAFNHEDTGGGHTLAVMSFDKATMTFSNLTDIANNPMYTLAWPAFTPDSNWVVFHAGSNAQFETDGGAVGDLFITDLATHTATRLNGADGYDASGTPYLPAHDPQLSFAPTVLPEAVGGYYWIVFTSHRSYGNTLPSQDNGDQNGKLWVAAMDINPVAGKDPSYPAFYLDGQEAKADNLRGFWVLDPCMQNGSTCDSGDECCGGYCRSHSGAAPTCDSTGGGCSQEFEKCTTSADCCNGGDRCINGKCSLTVPH
jgi:hypothetical protein